MHAFYPVMPFMCAGLISQAFNAVGFIVFSQVGLKLVESAIGLISDAADVVGDIDRQCQHLEQDHDEPVQQSCR